MRGPASRAAVEFPFLVKASRTQIEVDVAVLAPPEPGRSRRLLSLGEVKWAR